MAYNKNNPGSVQFSSWGRTRKIKNAAGTSATSLVSEAASPGDLTDGTLGYPTENQRYMHIVIDSFPGVPDNNAVFVIWGYNYAFGRWAILTRHASGFQNLWYNNGAKDNQLHHSQVSTQNSRYVLEIAGIDRIYLQHAGTFDAGVDKVYLGFNTF